MEWVPRYSYSKGNLWKDRAASQHRSTNERVSRRLEHLPNLSPRSSTIFTLGTPSQARSVYARSAACVKSMPRWGIPHFSSIFQPRLSTNVAQVTVTSNRVSEPMQGYGRRFFRRLLTSIIGWLGEIPKQSALLGNLLTQVEHLSCDYLSSARTIPAFRLMADVQCHKHIAV